MGVDASPLLSFLWPGTETNRDKRGQTGHFATNWETPPFSIFPPFSSLQKNFAPTRESLAISVQFGAAGDVATQIADGLRPRVEGP